MNVTEAEIETFFRRRILHWAARHGRDFPWRHADDPYCLLVAEMMLRRTRAQQVVPVYERFLTYFPTITALATADDQEIAVILYPLGLAWRAANFRHMARVIMAEHGGQIPRSRNGLLTLPGVGDYVASAVRCLAFDEPDVLIDTNTVRVAGRYFGFPTNAESRRRAPVRLQVARLIDPDRVRESNLALLDFAAIICRASRPLCSQCPVNNHCVWYNCTVVEGATVRGEDHARTDNRADSE